jgi:hypothetical protein
LISIVVAISILIVLLIKKKETIKRVTVIASGIACMLTTVYLLNISSVTLNPLVNELKGDKINILYAIYTCIVITFITMIVAFVTLKKVNERFNESIH